MTARPSSGSIWRVRSRLRALVPRRHGVVRASSPGPSTEWRLLCGNGALPGHLTRRLRPPTQLRASWKIGHRGGVGSPGLWFDICLKTRADPPQPGACFCIVIEHQRRDAAPFVVEGGALTHTSPFPAPHAERVMVGVCRPEPSRVCHDEAPSRRCCHLRAAGRPSRSPGARGSVIAAALDAQAPANLAYAMAPERGGAMPGPRADAPPTTPGGMPLMRSTRTWGSRCVCESR
jgi:hypothetical protein